MREHIFSHRSIAALEGVHPDLVRVITLGLQHSPIDFMITEGVRSRERQIQLYEQGFSLVHSGGTHEIQPDGYGHAVDVMAVGDLNGDRTCDHRDTLLTWDKANYGAIAFAVKRAAIELKVHIRWGGDFKRIFDGPHFEQCGEVMEDDLSYGWQSG